MANVLHHVRAKMRLGGQIGERILHSTSIRVVQSTVVQVQYKYSQSSRWWLLVRGLLSRGSQNLDSCTVQYGDSSTEYHIRVGLHIGGLEQW